MEEEATVCTPCVKIFKVYKVYKLHFNITHVETGEHICKECGMSLKK